MALLRKPPSDTELMGLSLFISDPLFHNKKRCKAKSADEELNHSQINSFHVGDEARILASRVLLLISSFATPETPAFLSRSTMK